MSRENVEVIHRGLEGLVRRDTDTARELMREHLAPDFVFESALTGRLYSGAEEALDLAVVADDHERSDGLALAAFMGQLQEQRERPLKDDAADVLGDPRLVQAADPEDVKISRPHDPLRRWQDPRFVDQLGKCDAAPAIRVQDSMIVTLFPRHRIDDGFSAFQLLLHHLRLLVVQLRHPDTT